MASSRTDEEITDIVNAFAQALSVALGDDFDQGYVVVESKGNAFISSSMTRSETRKSLLAVAREHAIDEEEED